MSNPSNKKLLLIVNPRSGKGGYKDCLAQVEYEIQQHGYVTTLVFTDCHGSATEIAAEHAAEYDRIVCMGGDGTLAETVTGLMRLPKADRVPLGYIPMGTTNDSASTFGISKNPVLAARTAVCGKPVPIDIGKSSSGYFTYVCAFGAFTEVSYETPQDTKNALGKLAYFLEALTRLPNLTHRRCRVEFDGGVVEGDYIFASVTNAYTVAGVLHLPDSIVSLQDGVFEVMLIRRPENVLDLGPTLSDIVTNNFTSEYVTMLHSKRVKFITAEPVAWTADGEGAGTHSIMTCENIPGAIEMMINIRE